MEAAAHKALRTRQKNTRRSLKTLKARKRARQDATLVKPLKPATEMLVSPRSKSLNARQELFCAEYLLDHNAGRAYMRAYPECKTIGSGRTLGSQLLMNRDVIAKVAQGTHRMLQALDMTAEETMATIAQGMRYDIRDLFDSQGNYRNIKELTKAQAAMISSCEIILKHAEAGDGHTDRVLKVKVVDRARYVEMAAKHFQLLLETIKLSSSLTIVDETLSDEELLAWLEGMVERAKARSRNVIEGAEV